VAAGWVTTETASVVTPERTEEEVAGSAGVARASTGTVSAPTPTGRPGAGPAGGRPTGPTGPGGGQGTPGAGPTGGRGPGSDATERSLAQAIARLEDHSVSEGSSTLGIVAGALAPGELVQRLIVGRVKGVRCSVVRTDRRLLIVADRPGRPLVQSLPPRTPVEVSGTADGTALVVVLDGGRVLRISGVRDWAEAVALARP
jgi:hypothetical protein